MDPTYIYQDDFYSDWPLEAGTVIKQDGHVIRVLGVCYGGEFHSDFLQKTSEKNLASRLQERVGQCPLGLETPEGTIMKPYRLE
jgi:hypothetical protein